MKSSRIDENRLFSWGAVGNPFRALDYKPKMFCGIDELSKVDKDREILIICETTHQSVCLGAWIMWVLGKSGFASWVSFHGTDHNNLNLEDPGSMVTVGIPVDTMELIDASNFGWKMFACPTTETFRAMKYISKAIRFMDHICSVPWARILLPMRHIPGQYFQRTTGHGGYDAIVEAAGATNDVHPVMRRKVRRWLKTHMAKDQLNYLNALMNTRSRDEADVLIDLIESV
jgi:hypothetical protein